MDCKTKRIRTFALVSVLLAIKVKPVAIHLFIENGVVYYFGKNVVTDVV